MALILDTPISGPSVWRGPEIASDRSWVHELSAQSLLEIHSAVAAVRDAGRAPPHFDRARFPLPSLGPQLAAHADELEHGRGLFLLRGLPVSELSDEELEIAYFGLGLHLGFPVRQNPRGDILGLVMNVGDLNDPRTRVYETNAYLPYHSDPSDVFGLLCVRKARSGGLSSLVSSPAVYNRILAERPDLLPVLYRPFYYEHLGDDQPGLSPVFSYFEGKLACRYLRQYIELGHDVMQVPLSAMETEALDVFDAVSQDAAMRLDLMLEPGDLLFANNYTVLHSRTGFEDFEDAASRRKLLRLWLKMPNARKLAPVFPGRNGFGTLATDTL